MEGGPVDVLRSDRHVPGELIPEEDYWQLEALDTIKCRWSNTRVCGWNVYSSAEKILFVILHNVTVVVTNSPSVLGGFSRPRLQITFYEDFYFPYSDFTHTKQSVGDQLTHISGKRDIAQFEFGQYQAEVKRINDNNRFSITRRDSDELIPNHLHHRLQEALHFVFAVQLNFTSVLYFEKQYTRLTIIAAPKERIPARLNPPLNFKSLAYMDHVYKMLNTYFTHVCHDPTDYWHPLGAVHYDLLCASPSNDALSLAVCVACENLVNMTSDKKHTNDKEDLEQIVERVKDYINNLDAAEDIKSRLIGSIASVLSPRAIDLFYLLANQGIVRKEMVEGWKALRNKTAHGNRDESELSKRLSRINNVLTLYYCLVFHIIEYKGLFVDRSKRGWPVVEYKGRKDPNISLADSSVSTPDAGDGKT